MNTNININSQANIEPACIRTVEEEAIIMGTLLGDANLQRRGPKSYRLKIDHSIDQADYVKWKHKKLIRLCQTTQPPKETIDSKGYKGLEFYTTSGMYLAKYHDLFYKRPLPRRAFGSNPPQTLPPLGSGQGLGRVWGKPQKILRKWHYL